MNSQITAVAKNYRISVLAISIVTYRTFCILFLSMDGGFAVHRSRRA